MKPCKLRNLFPIISAFFLHACIPIHWALKGTRRSGETFSKSHRWVDAQATEEAAILSSSGLPYGKYSLERLCCTFPPTTRAGLSGAGLAVRMCSLQWKIQKCFPPSVTSLVLPHLSAHLNSACRWLAVPSLPASPQFQPLCHSHLGHRQHVFPSYPRLRLSPHSLAEF